MFDARSKITVGFLSAVSIVCLSVAAVADWGGAGGGSGALSVPSVISNAVTQTSGSFYALINGLVTVNPSASSTAIVAGDVTEMDYASTAAAITGSGHLVPKVAWTKNQNSTNTLPLAPGLESKFENDVSGAHAGSVFQGWFQMPQNVAGATIDNWFGGFADISSNGGTITSAFAAGLQLDANAGTITTIGGLQIPPLTSTGTIGTLYGLYFAGQTATMGAKYVVYGNDVNAPIYNQGVIQTATLVITGVATYAALVAAKACNAANKGGRATITDGASATFHATAAGGGSNIVGVMCDGTNYLVGG